MKHIPNDSQRHLPLDHIRSDERAATTDDCLACHIRAAYNMLGRSVEILRGLAMRKRHTCFVAGTCSNTGLPMAGNEPPHSETCECFLTRRLVHEVFDVEAILEVKLDEADRLARMAGPGRSKEDGRDLWRDVPSDEGTRGSTPVRRGTSRGKGNPEGLQQEHLTDEERQAVERLARRRA